VRCRWLSALVVSTVVLGAGAQVAAASQSKSVMAQWRAAEKPFTAADYRWSNVIGQSNAPWTKVKAANGAFVPAIKTFNTALGKIHFTGSAAGDIGKVIALQKQEITLLSTASSEKTFVSGFKALVPKFVQLQTALGKDLGVPAGDIII